MSELVMTSWLARILLALVLSSAAAYGSCRPVENQSWLVDTPAVPALMLTKVYLRLTNADTGQAITVTSMCAQDARGYS